jgi:hypothetical protein
MTVEDVSTMTKSKMITVNKSGRDYFIRLDHITFIEMPLGKPIGFTQTGPQMATISLLCGERIQLPIEEAIKIIDALSEPEEGEPDV